MEAVAAARSGDVPSLGAVASGAYGVVTRSPSARYAPRGLLAHGLATGGVLVALVGVPADEVLGASLVVGGLAVVRLGGPPSGRRSGWS